MGNKAFGAGEAKGYDKGHEEGYWQGNNKGRKEGGFWGLAIGVIGIIAAVILKKK